ncbi:leucyl aminopeptidase [Actinomarinicola tropica]|uniref:leucyl aminopeptidase n=1 Tax=Actinomarinicola tropica TaxID=2789776 RepID=UPI001897D324|nr:leucyl aminopeptidase [Actinomarinicola tropica]
MPITFRPARSRPKGVDVVARGVTRAEVAAGAAPGPSAYLAAQGFEGSVGQAVALPGDDRTTLVLVGLGDADAVDAATVRAAGAAVARAARRARRVAIEPGVLEGGLDAASVASALVEGVVLASYRYRAHKTDTAPEGIESVTLVGPTGAAVSSAVERATALAEATCWARDLVNEPGGSMTPLEVAKAVRKMARREKLKVSVMDEAAIRAAGLGGLLGVNRGSEQPPRFVTVSYTPAGTPTGSIALVGKGITFDSGGLSIKTADGMSTMKSDMGGAAAVFGAMSALAAVGATTAVTAYVPLTDNMTGGDATRPGDVLTIRGGTTVEVLNTDAEGRLILADALVMASESQPDAIVDVATLTGACMVALGNRIAGLMGRGDALLDQVETAAARTGERVWRLPLPDDMRPQLDSKIADLKNIGAGRYGGASIAGLFLREFVADGIPWAHLDIAGPAWSDDDRGEVTAGGTGFGVRLLVDLIEGFERSTAG